MIITVNGRNYEHITTKLERQAKINYSKNTGETLANTLILDPLSTRLSYLLTFDSSLKDQQALERLWDDLIVPRVEGVSITMPYNQTTISFVAKVESVNQRYVSTIDGVQVWDKISVVFEAITPFLEV